MIITIMIPSGPSVLTGVIPIGAGVGLSDIHIIIGDIILTIIITGRITIAGGTIPILIITALIGMDIMAIITITIIIAAMFITGIGTQGIRIPTIRPEEVILQRLRLTPGPQGLPTTVPGLLHLDIQIRKVRVLPVEVLNHAGQ